MTTCIGCWNVRRSANPVGTATLRAVSPGWTEDYRNAPELIPVEGNVVARVEMHNGKKAERPFSVKAGAKTSEEVALGP
jgi:hypothetical protein